MQLSTQKVRKSPDISTYPFFFMNNPARNAILDSHVTPEISQVRAIPKSYFLQNTHKKDDSST